MTAPVASTITRRGRHYVDKQTGACYPSVTTVIDRALSKPSLLHWYARQTATRAVEQLAELSRTVRLDGAETAIRWLTAAPRERKTAAAVAGSDLHDLAERHARGEPLPDSLDPAVRAMLGQYERFLADFSPEITHTEMTVLNRSMGYGGTCDAVMRLDGHAVPLVVDYKTGRTGPYPEWAIQLAAYAGGECVLTRDRAGVVESPMPAVDHDTALILRIRPETYEVHEANLSGLVEVFAGMLQIHRFTEAQPPFTIRYAESMRPAYWISQINAANTTDELTTIWVDAVIANAWTDELTTISKTRKAQILAGDNPQ